MIQDIDELCSKDIYLCFADDKDRLSPAFYHVLVRVMDGAEVAATLPWLCDVNQHPVCNCPHSESDRTIVAYSHSDIESVKQAVSATLSVCSSIDDDGQDYERKTPNFPPNFSA